MPLLYVANTKTHDKSAGKQTYDDNDASYTRCSIRSNTHDLLQAQFRLWTITHRKYFFIWSNLYVELNNKFISSNYGNLSILIVKCVLE